MTKIRNPIASAITVELDKPRTLILDFNAFAAFREATGKELPDLVSGLYKFDEQTGALIADKAAWMTSGQILAMVWAGLLHEDPSLTMQQVGRYMSGRNHTELFAAALESMNGNEEKTADPTLDAAMENPNPLNRGTGTGSDPSVASSLELVTTPSSGA